MIAVEDPVSVALIQYGAVGAIAIMALYAVRILFNRITEQAARDRDRADRLEDELRKLNDVVRTEYLGTLAKATEAIADALASRRRG
jgi:dihydrodipicolinate synthase/N-acetylneuraminate lyase